MRIDILTLFPEMCEEVLKESIIGRARKNGFVEINCRNIRDFANNKHNHVDDTPYGGGMGMIMQAEPIYECYKSVCDEIKSKPYVVYMSPQGNVLTQEKVKDFSKLDDLIILCGHYEGVDERIIEEIVDEEISVGDYVLTGGELPALTLADSITRLLPGVLSEDVCFEDESHYNGLLEYPQYTRPVEWHGKKVPDVLLSGHHTNIERFRRDKSLERTQKKRPDMIEKIKDKLSKEDLEVLNKQE